MVLLPYCRCFRMGRFRAFSKRDTKKPLFSKKMEISGPVSLILIPFLPYLTTIVTHSAGSRYLSANSLS